MNKLNFALVGCGNIAPRHAQHIKKLGNLVAVCDKNRDKADKFAEEYATKSYYDLDNLLGEERNLDVVSICSPNGLHAEHTIRALKAGVNVLCEKPMAIRGKDCEKMITTAERANKRLFIIKQNRFNPPVAALKQAIDEGKLGRIVNVQLSCFWNRNDDYYSKSEWKGKMDMDGGTLFTQFSHFIDLLYWLVGDVKTVYPIMGNFLHTDQIDFEDTGVVALEFDTGALGTINFTVNSYGQNMEGSLTVFGEYGTVKIGGQYLNELEYQSIRDFEITNLPKSSEANDYGQYRGSMSNHDKVYENLIDVLQNQGSITTNSLEGLKTVQIIEKIYESKRV